MAIAVKAEGVMRARRGFIVVMSLAAAMMQPAASAAQSAQSSLPVAVGQEPVFRWPVSLGRKVRITAADGRVIEGNVEKLAPDSIEIGEDAGRSSRLAAADVSRIQVPGFPRGGVLKGALIGGLVGGLLGGAAGGLKFVDEGLSSGDPDPRGVEESMDAGIAAGIAAGALLGYATGTHKMKTVYDRTPVGEAIGVGQNVWATSFDGRVTKGRVLSLTPTSVEIGGNGVAPTLLAATDVRRIRIPDSVRNGVVKGALIGGLAGVSWGMGESFPGVFPPESSGSNFVVGAAAGALLGWAIDSAKLATVYQREAGGTSVSVRPITSNAGKGVGVQVRW